jgi:feruloyl-CoA synthase
MFMQHEVRRDHSSDVAALPAIETLLAPPRCVRTELGGGVFTLRSPEPLQPYTRCIGDWLEKWAAAAPQRTFLAERDAERQWRHLSYAQARTVVGSIGQGLLDLELPEGRPVVILSDNSIDHALLLLAAMHVGRPVCVLPSAYSRLVNNYKRISQILQPLRPALIYASSAAAYGDAIMAARIDCPVVYSSLAGAQPGAIGFEALTRVIETSAVSRAFASIRAEDTAKLLLTSGSIELPKVVINTHRMMCANQQAMSQLWHFFEQEPPVIVDWLPWSHTFGGNHNFNMVLCHGGSLYIDDGRPTPILLERTVRNLTDVKPTMCFNVPQGYDALAGVLETNWGFAQAFFSRLRVLFYAAAALPPSTWQRLDKVASQVCRRPLWFTSSWGSTETAPALTNVHWRNSDPACIGLPLPGVELKFVPHDGKLEMRARGPSIFPGYYNAPEQTKECFDEDGYFCVGDAGRLLDPERPELGIAFDSRIPEDFKLTNATWVSVSRLRVAVISALAPWVQDVVVTGEGRNEIGLLIFPSTAAKKLPAGELAGRLRESMLAMRATGRGTSQTPMRAMVLDEPPSMDAGEITDKGYLNQRRVLSVRAALVEMLYATPRFPNVICINA